MSKTLERLFRKKTKLIVGLMSGTSADGIDAVLVRVSGSGAKTKVQQLAFQTYQYPSGFKRFLLKNSDASTARLDDVTRLDMLIAQLFSEAVRKLLRNTGYSLQDIDLIGSHGQTIHHLPLSKKIFNHTVGSTLQIGHPSAIAKYTGIVTVGDFRVADIALNGNGAPLVPYFDYLMFRSAQLNRALLNIGGIANITVLPKNCALTDVVAFDTGPGNMIIDGLTDKLFHKPFDRDGRFASAGKINVGLIRYLMQNKYFKQRPPKSTGRELFSEEFQRNVLQKSKGMRREDILATVTEVTALSIYDSYIRFVRKKTKLDDLLVSGGGVHNVYIMNALKMYFGETKVIPLSQKQFSSDAKEAVCFAVLANETISGNSGNLPAVTGAKRSTPLGVICLP